MAFDDLNALTVEVATTDVSNRNDLVTPLDSDGLLAVIRTTYADQKEYIPDFVDLFEPIHEVGLYECRMTKDGQMFERKLWVVPAELGD
jgi:hypothetical protein